MSLPVSQAHKITELTCYSMLQLKQTGYYAHACAVFDRIFHRDGGHAHTGTRHTALTRRTHGLYTEALREE
jgi:hypothetical protein